MHDAFVSLAGPADLVNGEALFDDAAAPGWFDVNVGVGFDATGSGALDEFIHPQGDIQTQMLGQNSTSLLRVPFHVSDVAS